VLNQEVGGGFYHIFENMGKIEMLEMWWAS
jgi:hypothetical protein